MLKNMIYTLARILWLTLCWIELILFTLPLYLLSFLPHSLSQSFFPPLFHSWSRAFVRALGVNLRLHQKNARPLPQRYILIANHPSAFEDIGIPALFNVNSLAKIQVKDWWISGRISQAAGTLFVDRDSKESRSAAAEAIEQALLAGKNIALYPEGGCKGRRLHSSFRYGAFDISLRTGIPIVPVFLHYEAQQDFEWPDKVLLLRKIWDFMTTQNNRVNYYVHDAFQPADFDNKEVYCEHVYQQYLKWQSRYLE
ncbi:MAG: 1-acyl-sn-glycerol-3-phosphate acyltransferase [gamma proteobacterium symbiont of Bathyaustriella thionipta]|nr:1-acyl-sn-glycerol-3-phosphate acyltransferase [gamma proteobacterium symbiont of Bathyaustriella thionipta]